MPTGIYKHKKYTEERKKRHSEMAKKLNFGKWMKGKKASNETRKKLSKIVRNRLKNNPNFLEKAQNARRESTNSEEHKKAISKAMKGRKLWNEEDKKRISLQHKGKKLPPRSKEYRLNISLRQRGEKSNLWKGGITPINKEIRMSLEYKLWREAVFLRDNFTDQKTGIRGGKLHPHHIKNFAQFPELRFAINNGITLSDKSHREFHRLYGRKNNTLEQLIEFLK